MLGIKEKCYHFIIQSMEEKQKQQNKQQEQPHQPIEPTQGIIRHREIPLWGWIAVIGYMLLVDNLPS